MYKFVKHLSLSFVLTAALFSCGKKDDSPAPSSGNGDSNWKIGSYSYSRAASSQTSNGLFTAIVVTTSGNGGNYGAFSGSSLTFTMNSNLGAGTYTLGNLNQLIAAGPAARILVMDCGIGTAVNTGSTFYTSVSGTADVTVDGNGQYHVTVAQPAMVTKTNVVSGGVSGADNSYSVTISNAY